MKNAASEGAAFLRKKWRLSVYGTLLLCCGKRLTRYCVKTSKSTQKLGWKLFSNFLKKRLDFWLYTQYNLNVRESRKRLENLCFEQGKQPFFVICDKGPWKLNNEEETRNYFESIRGTKVLRRVLKKLQMWNTHQVIWKTDYSNTQVFIWANQL